MQTHILYVPLDERPCNYIYPQYIAAMGGAQLTLPPMELLGHFKTPADVDGLWHWLAAHAAGATHMVLSMDMLCYGGIVPSRLHHLTEEQCAERTRRLAGLRAQFPQAQLYVFQLITRAPARNGSGEEPDYYEAHGYDIFRYGVIGDKEAAGTATAQEIAEKEAIGSRVPAADLADFTHRRLVNFGGNLRLLQLYAQDKIDHLVIPLDDCFEYGYAPAERRKLAEKARELNILSRIAMYPGADEMGCTLVARALCNGAGVRPAVWTEWSSESGRLTVPPYEDRRICETLPHHIRCAGGCAANSPEQADAVLMVNPPTLFSNRIMFELDRRQLYLEPERNLNEFTARIREHLDSGRLCVVADCAVPNGADPCLMQFLQEERLLPRLTGFSGWNTSSNAAGTAIAVAAARACARQSGADTARAAALEKEFCTLRYLEDWGYMTLVRENIAEQIAAGAYGAGLDVRYLGGQTPAIEKDVSEQLAAFAHRHLAPFQWDLKARLPWQRMFETELSLTPPK